MTAKTKFPDFMGNSFNIPSDANKWVDTWLLNWIDGPYITKYTNSKITGCQILETPVLDFSHSLDCEITCTMLKPFREIQSNLSTE